MTEEASNEWVWDVDGKDKADWPVGPWATEPDKVVWVDEASDLDCMIVRGPSGALCGYVGVPNGHPHYGKDYSDIHVDVHGGLTFANECHGTICHVPQPGRTDDVWWLGFDCAHAFDFCPAFANVSPAFAQMPSETYKTIAYVRREVENLAHQLVLGPVES